MAFNYIGSAATGTGTTVTYSPTAGSLIVIYTVTSAGAGNPYITSVSDGHSGVWNGVLGAINNAANIFHDGANAYYGAFFQQNCVAGITTVTTAYNGGTPGTSSIYIIEYSGITNSGALIASVTSNQTNPGAGADLVTSGNINVLSQPGLLLSFFNNNNGSNSFTAGSAMTLRRKGNSPSGNSSYILQDKRVTATGNTTATATDSQGAAIVDGGITIAFLEGIVGPVQETQSTGSSGTSVPLAFVSNQGAGNSNHIVVRALTSNAFSVTDSQGNTYAQRGATLNDGGAGHFEAQFTCDNVSAGANTVTVACSPSGTSINVWIREIGYTSGFDTHVEQVQIAFGSATSDAVTTGSVNPNFSPGMVSGFTNITPANPPALSSGSGYTSDGSPWGAGTTISQHQRYVGSTAQASTTTASTSASTNAFSFAALFKEIGAVAGKTLGSQTAIFSEGPASRSVSYTPTAQTITSSAGTISSALSKSLTGQTATFGEGNLLNALNLLGQTATFAPGTITKFVSGNVTNSLSGLSASFGQGNLSLSISYLLDSNVVTLIGQTANFGMGQITATVTPAITAQTATFTEGSISAGATTGPSYTLVGRTATFTPGTISASQPGNVTTQLSGQTATFTEGVPVDVLSYGLTASTITSSEGIISFSTSGNIAFLLGSQTASFTEGLLTVAFPGGMPNVVGYLVQEATLILEQSGVLQPKKIGYFGTYPITYHWIASSLPPSIVLAQSVAPGTSYVVNMPITLTLSEFPFSVSPGG